MAMLLGREYERWENFLFQENKTELPEQDSDWSPASDYGGFW
jgi:hypothetical protein